MWQLLNKFKEDLSMLKVRMRIGLLLGLNFLGVSVAQADVTSMYVQSVKAVIRSEAKSSAAQVAELKRGDKVEAIETQGFWVRVKVSGKEGWVSKLSLADKPPIGQNTLLKATEISDAKASRKRAKDDLAASARGLGATPDSARHRGNQNKYRDDVESVEKMKQFSVPEKDIQGFLNEANLD